ncbi:MAG: hypothetical protein ABIK44_01370, partial [candidate division WOR-3 bacterium]
AFLLAFGFERLISPSSLLVEFAEVLGSGAIGLILYYRLALWLRVREVRQALTDLIHRSS